MNEVIKNILERRSIRDYKERQIAKEDMELIMKAAIYAPSGMNKQSWHFTVLQDKEKLQSLGEAIRKALSQPEGYCCYYNAPTLVITANQKNNDNGQADCAVALENIFLAAKSLGIGSCWINQLRRCCDVPEVREILTELGIPEDYAVYGSAALGYAKADVQAKQRAEGTVSYV